jgi:MFS family permease
VLGFSFAAWIAVLAGWATLAGGIFSAQLAVVLVLQFLMGLLGALVSMSNTRLAMAVIPVMGRNHFFAIYSVVSNVSLGLAPIAWGLLIDAVGVHSPVWLGLEWNRFTIFFAGRQRFGSRYPRAPTDDPRQRAWRNCCANISNPRNASGLHLPRVVIVAARHHALDPANQPRPSVS